MVASIEEEEGSAEKRKAIFGERESRRGVLRVTTKNGPGVQGEEDGVDQPIRGERIDRERGAA